MEMNNVWAIDTGLLSKQSLENIRASGHIGQDVWFANIDDDQVAFAVFKNGVATQVQCVPSITGRIVISRRLFFLKTLTPRDCSMLRGGKNMLVIPYESEDPIVAGAPAEREVYFIDREKMRVQIIVY